MAAFHCKWKRYCAAASLMLLMANCTENPFGSDSNISTKTTVSGRVILLNSSSSEGVYVWLEGLNAGVFTGPNGDFLLRLPSPSSQPGGGFTGSANLYFYMANFQLDSTRLVLRSGEFLYSQGELNEKGELLRPRTLTKLLNVSTALRPSAIPVSYDSTLETIVTLQVLALQVELLAYGAGSNFLTLAAIQKINTEQAWVSSLYSGFLQIDTTFFSGTYVFTTSYLLDSYFLTPGDYLVIPYLWIKQDHLPRGLIHSLDAAYEKFDLNYVNIPFQREGGRLTVTAD